MRFAVVDLSGKLALHDLMAYAAAQQKQLRLDYAEHYDGDGVTDEVRVGTPSDDANPIEEVRILLHPTVPADAGESALGIHDRQANGCPIIHVYLDLAIKYGDTWQSIASHEVLETRADPRLHRCVELDNGEIWDQEISDRVEADSYLIDGVPMSNFNTPQCFEPSDDERGPFDHMGLSTKPNQVRPGGYAQRLDPAKGWEMVGAMRGYRAELAAKKLTRSHLRRRRAKIAKTARLAMGDVAAAEKIAGPVVADGRANLIP